MEIKRKFRPKFRPGYNLKLMDQVLQAVPLGKAHSINKC